jgi:hypothetical protein
MAEAMTAAGHAGVPAPKPERAVYAASGGRKLAFSFVFLLLLPFFASLPAMLFWRLSQGHWLGTFGLLVLAAAFAFIMLLVVVELTQSLRSRVELGDASVKLTLPAGRGPTPMLRYRSHDIPYDQIKAVETRGEVYGGSVAPVLLKGARLILKDDSVVKLGYVSEANTDPCFPFPEIAQKIAARAGVPIEHKGSVRRSAQKKFLGLKQGLIGEPETPVGDYEMVVLNNHHQRWVMRLVWLLAGLVVLGIAMDIIFPPSSGLPPALTSLTSFVTGGSSATPEEKKAK